MLAPARYSDHALELFESEQHAQFFLNLIARDDHDLLHAFRFRERANRMRNQWFARDRRKELIETNAPAAAAGDEDRTEHRRYCGFNCRCTSWLTLLPSARPAIFA